MKYIFCLCLIIIYSKSFSQQRNEKITYLCLDRAEHNLHFLGRLNSIIKSLNQNDPDLIGKFSYPDQDEAKAYYDEPNALKARYYNTVGTFFVCFEIADIKTSHFTDEKMLTITVFNLKPNVPVAKVILRKNILEDDLESVIIPNVKHHLLKLFEGTQTWKPYLNVYDDGSHDACSTHSLYFKSFFTDPNLLDKFYIERVGAKTGNGKNISCGAGPDNNFIFINNGVPASTLKIDCDKALTKDNYNAFRNYILTNH